RDPGVVEHRVQHDWVGKIQRRTTLTQRREGEVQQHPRSGRPWNRVGKRIEYQADGAGGVVDRPAVKNGISGERQELALAHRLRTQHGRVPGEIELERVQIEYVTGEYIYRERATRSDMNVGV